MLLQQRNSIIINPSCLSDSSSTIPSNPLRRRSQGKCCFLFRFDLLFSLLLYNRIHVTDLHSRFTEAKESIKGKPLQRDSHAPSHSNAGKKLGVVKPLPPKVVSVIDARSKAKPVPRHAPDPPKTQVESKFSPEMSEEQRAVELQKFVDFFTQITLFDEPFSTKLSQSFLAQNWTLGSALAIVKAAR